MASLGSKYQPYIGEAHKSSMTNKLIADNHYGEFFLTASSVGASASKAIMSGCRGTSSTTLHHITTTLQEAPQLAAARSSN